MSLMQADWPMTALKFEQKDDIQASVVHLDPPVDAVYAYINAHGGDIRWRDDGTDPDGDTGHVLKDTDDLWYTADLKRIAFVRDSGSSSTTDMSVTYYKPQQASDG
jgi:hypothetical protein